jgi:hypothetical protein
MMPQLLDRSQVSTTIAVPLDLIEAETLSLLGVEIIDIQDNIDDCIPQGDIRYWVQRGETELLGGMANWGDRFDTPDSPIGSYATLFIAATSYLPRGEVKSAYRKAKALLTERFASAPDYM